MLFELPDSLFSERGGVEAKKEFGKGSVGVTVDGAVAVEKSFG